MSTMVTLFAIDHNYSQGLFVSFGVTVVSLGLEQGLACGSAHGHFLWSVGQTLNYKSEN